MNPLLQKFLSWKGEVWAKAEYQNPTGSFKDRGSINEVCAAVRLKKQGVVCASTGNMAASLSAYAARARLPCFVVVPQKTPATKLRQALACGATLIPVDGSYDDCVAKAAKASEDRNFLLCGDYEIRRIGQRTIGVELAASGIPFDAFVVPVGNGTLGCAVSEGFTQENQTPSFIGVQAHGADPIYRAWKSNDSIIRIIEAKTIASAINVGNPLDGKRTLEWITKTSGVLFSVSDEEIISAQNLLAQTEGIFVERAAAATIAVLPGLTSSLPIIVFILTGSGLKES